MVTDRRIWYNSHIHISHIYIYRGIEEVPAAEEFRISDPNMREDLKPLPGCGSTECAKQHTA